MRAAKPEGGAAAYAAESAYQVRLAGLLERQDSQGLEAQVCAQTKHLQTLGGAARRHASPGREGGNTGARRHRAAGAQGDTGRTGLEVLSDLAHEALERQFADEQLGAADSSNSRRPCVRCI